MKLQLQGIDTLEKALKDKAKLQAAKALVKYYGAAIQRDAQDSAPVDTGNLKRSISLEYSEGAASAKAEIKATADYSGYVEYGTRYMDAQPFMRPSFNKNKLLFEKEIKALAGK